ncbi:hypothetical protein KJ848_01815 [Patescibacteria group bacterium]|nr:hypothetical protein [Patescibacteria group bacterium]
MKILYSIAALIILIGLGAGAYYYFGDRSGTAMAPTGQSDEVPSGTESDDTMNPGMTVIGKSVEGRDITAYHYGTGEDELLFVGGIHGGYEWNTSLVAYELIDYLTEHPEAIPANESVTVIPTLNPDGLEKGIGVEGRFTAADVTKSLAATIPGRFNANNVDLNRNFECDWQPTGTWQNKEVSAGTSAFSEPESKAIKSYIESNRPTAVVVWYSAAGGVYASNCHRGVTKETSEITKVYADASGYPAHQEFDFYEITGDMVNWLAKNDITGISVLLTNHTDVEWNKNKAGIEALFAHYAK